MTDGRYSFVQLREAAHTAKIFGFRGDPTKELIEMNTPQQLNANDKYAADDAGTDKVLLMARGAGLQCLKPLGNGEALNAGQIAQRYPDQSEELKDAIAVEQTIALARAVGLNCVRPA